jgi:hypothetical protein
MLIKIKAYRKTTKNGKEVILPLLESVLDNKTYFINRGFDVTVDIPDSEIARLTESGVLWDSSKRNSTNTTNTTKVVDDGGEGL